MKLILLAHPSFLNSTSMARFSGALAEEMASRGHSVKIWSPSQIFFNIPLHGGIRKWFGYIDQYVIFPFLMRRWLKKTPSDTLFVFTDQALGSWVPIIGNRPHVIHCHDFMAQRSGLGEIKENCTKWSGKRYQAMIRSGYQRGRNFIPVSEKTKKELFRFVSGGSVFASIVYNWIEKVFTPYDKIEVRREMSELAGRDLKDGYILHIGGNQWYKNRKGVVAIYDAWRSATALNMPLLLVGAKYSSALARRVEDSPYREDILNLSGLGDQQLSKAYSGASVFLFPSYDEGFGWPVAEAMACGCQVITTGNSPMTEVGGDAAFYIPRCPDNEELIGGWAQSSAKVLNTVLEVPENQKKSRLEMGFENVKRFEKGRQMTKIEDIYRKILES